MRCLLLVALLPFLPACAGPVRSLYPPRPGGPARVVYVVNHGNVHSGIAVKRADIPKHLWPARLDYPRARYIEVGWGDEDGFRKDRTSGMIVKALIHSTRTVLQMDGFSKTLRKNFDDPACTIIEVKISREGFERLCRHIEKTYALDPAGRPIPLGDDYYRARGTYCLFNTCNTWVAAALRAAGCPIVPAWCIMPGPLLKQTRKFGRVIPPGAATPSRD